MAAISRFTIINVVTFKNRLKERLNEILPSGGYSSSNLPNAQMAFLVTTRESLLGDIYNIVNNDTTLTTNTVINSTKVFNLIKNVFIDVEKYIIIMLKVIPVRELHKLLIRLLII